MGAEWEPSDPFNSIESHSTAPNNCIFPAVITSPLVEASFRLRTHRRDRRVRLIAVRVGWGDLCDVLPGSVRLSSPCAGPLPCELAGAVAGGRPMIEHQPRLDAPVRRSLCDRSGPQAGVGPARYGGLMPQRWQLHILGRGRSGEQSQPVDKPDKDQVQQS